MIYGYIGKSTDKNVSADILNKLGKINAPVYPTGIYENVFVADSGPSTSYKEDLIKEYKSKRLAEGFNSVETERFEPLESWKNLETTAIASDNSLILARGNKEQLYIMDLRNQLNQIWAFTIEFMSAFSQFSNDNAIFLPDYHIWELKTWQFKKSKVNFRPAFAS